MTGTPARTARVTSPARGYTRPPFERDNTAALKSGAYVATWRLSEEVEEKSAWLREIAPVFTPADEPVVTLFAVTLCRIEKATVALDDADAASLETLRRDLRSWIGLARRLASDLGMTPASRARLGLDLALTQRALTVVDLHAAAEDEGATG